MLRMSCLHVGKKMTIARIVHVFILLFFGVFRQALRSIVGKAVAGSRGFDSRWGHLIFFFNLNLPAAL